MMVRFVLNKYFDELESLLKRLGIEDKPQQIWNCDETSVQFSPSASKVISQKGIQNVVARCSPSKDSITILVTIKVSGGVMPPFCTVKGKTERSFQLFTTQDAPYGIIRTYQQNMWMNNEIRIQWFEKVFLPKCGDARPQVLILASHHSHEVLEMLELADKHPLYWPCNPIPLISCSL